MLGGIGICPCQEHCPIGIVSPAGPDLLSVNDEIIAVLNSVVSAVYYLRVVKVMWLGEPASEEKVSSSAALRVALSLACLGVLVIGILPGAAMKVAETAARIFGS